MFKCFICRNTYKSKHSYVIKLKKKNIKLWDVQFATIYGFEESKIALTIKISQKIFEFYIWKEINYIEPNLRL